MARYGDPVNLTVRNRWSVATAASLMLEASGDLYFVKGQLGHGSIKVTKRYSHTYPGSGNAKIAELDALHRDAVGPAWDSQEDPTDQKDAA